jgi:hypothetical protein
MMGILFGTLNLVNQPVLASQNGESTPLVGEALCLPGIYPQTQQDCLLEGPARTLSDLSAAGITFPPTPLPFATPPSDLAIIPYYYARVNDGPAPLYNYRPSEPGMTATRILDGGLRYISYIQRMETNAGLFYQFGTGEWIDGGNVARAAPPDFQGFLIRAALPHPFGWILTTAISRSSPGYSAPETGQNYNRFNIVDIYESQMVDGVEWCRIGVNEWIEKRVVARVTPSETSPDGVGNGRWIEINLFEQTLMVYDQGQLIFATLISTGFDPFFTQPGLFQIYERLESETMSGSFEADHSDYYYLEDVPFTMYFDQARALHGAYWHSIFGYPRSHGCVNLSISDSHWLYNWAQVGDWVYVWDPSGATPTDPAYYGQGGA